MVKGKRLRNYLVYAVGEIILVVFGILIALWINNWNKEKEVENTNKILQEKVLAQLEVDMDLIDKFSKDLDTLNSVYLKILDRDYDGSKVNAGKIIYTVLFDVKSRIS
jgi:hypothetical protein